jgi:hypothetical protein
MVGSTSCGYDSDSDAAAVNVDHGAVHERGFVAGEVHRGMSDGVGRTASARRGASHHHLGRMFAPSA